jgi:hypothetical protein
MRAEFFDRTGEHVGSDEYDQETYPTVEGWYRDLRGVRTLFNLRGIQDGCSFWREVDA